ncbi:hypothetical protein DPMN_013983 [Dreissena polymorpha]|uniref:Uncharacterized protein n=1 Tax=Dreissena polymorpha TaxID=45954 RepID=A0A9D4N8S2_DREPO|nr:hypothetical protein DPMN_013983 [Dreissena polymorpha]
MKIKLLGGQYEVLSQCIVSGNPEDICQMTHTEVAITVNGAATHWVQFITVSNGQLLKGRTIQLPHHCAGIVQNQGDMFITSTTALYKYTLSVYRCAVSANGDTIYIKNRGQNKLLTLSRNGTVLSIFSDPELKEPTGVHLTTGDQVLVCFGGSNAIVKLNKNGSRKVTTLVKEEDGLNCPESVFYNINRKKLIIGYEFNNISVFYSKRSCSIM